MGTFNPYPLLSVSPRRFGTGVADPGRRVRRCPTVTEPMS